MYYRYYSILRFFSNFISIELKFPAYFIIIWVILVIHWIFNYLPDQEQCTTLSKEPEMSMCKQFTAAVDGRKVIRAQENAQKVQ